MRIELRFGGSCVKAMVIDWRSKFTASANGESDSTSKLKKHTSRKVVDAI
jgi:hypothetical protein